MELNPQSLLESLGIVAALGWVIWGLRNQLKALNSTISTQNKTLDAMERRISETEKIGNLYKDFLKDVPDVLSHYKEFINKTKDETISELEKAKELADRELKLYKEKELQRLESEEKRVNVVISNVNHINTNINNTGSSNRVYFHSLIDTTELLVEDVEMELKILGTNQSEIDSIKAEIETVNLALEKIESFYENGNEPSTRTKAVLERFILNLCEEDSSLAKTLGILRKGHDYRIQLAKDYNRVATSLGMPLLSSFKIENLEKIRNTSN